MIKVQNLIKMYGSFQALNQVSFEVKDGEIMGFLGPNGAGKTTTMKILTGYMPPTSGRAIINDLDIETSSMAIRQKVGYLPESNPLYLDFTVEESLKFTADIRKLPKPEIAGAIKRVVGQCGISSVYYKPIEHLSKGFRQRVGLAQALVHDPEILILDEPTVGLDPKQIIEIRDLILTLRKNRTVLLSTHIMQEAQALCDRVTIINEGKIVASDTTTNLKKLSEQKMATTIFTKIAGTNKKVIAMLGKIPGVEDVKKVEEEKKGLAGYLLSVEHGQDVRAEIFQQAVDNGCTVYEL
ncbi:MAG TPA: ATP-binding cassette domain-containing protein, partial [Candidatus Wirthbacteria bacterium]|nr:ATP-binding cassette domain-containing protein [Candidatus Wirthbacteria bacterium]